MKYAESRVLTPILTAEQAGECLTPVDVESMQKIMRILAVAIVFVT